MSDVKAFILVLTLTLFAFFFAKHALADEGASTHESCYSDIPCSNPKAECILDPWSLLGSGECSAPYEGVKVDTIDSFKDKY